MRWPSLSTFYFFGYNAEMKINSKEIETTLKFMLVVKINKEFNENVPGTDWFYEKERRAESKNALHFQVLL